MFNQFNVKIVTFDPSKENIFHHQRATEPNVGWFEIWSLVQSYIHIQSASFNHINHNKNKRKLIHQLELNLFYHWHIETYVQNHAVVTLLLELNALSSVFHFFIEWNEIDD